MVRLLEAAKSLKVMGSSPPKLSIKLEENTLVDHMHPWNSFVLDASTLELPGGMPSQEQ